MKGFVDIRISGDALNFQEITESLGITPSHICKKGDTHVSKIIKGQTTIYKEDCWISGGETENDEIVEHCIERFVSSILPASDYLKELSNNYVITLWVSTYPESEQTNIHLSKTAIKALSEMGMSLDCSSAFLKDFYDGTYAK